MKYLLPSYVHLYANTELAILLDLRHDAYIGLDKRQVNALQPLVRGWSGKEPARAAVAVDADAVAFANRLLERGLLTLNENEGKDAAPMTLVPIEAPLIAKYSDDRRALRAGHMVNFVRACLVARVSLSFGSLERLVRRMTKRKAACRSPLDEDKLRDLTIVFHRLRPYLYTAQKRCLFDSVALAEFLAAYDVFPTWVIGVQPAPFAAHAWVQHDKFILNGEAEFARRYAPIMAI